MFLCGALWAILLVAAEKKKPVSQIDADYLTPAEPIKHKHRQKCSDLGQVEALKGVWVSPHLVLRLTSKSPEQVYTSKCYAVISP